MSDVWSINEKLKVKIGELRDLEIRVAHIESFLIDLTAKKDEKLLFHN